jgi:membrane-associated protease RseP (regulator of RpoE activity)
MDWNNNGNHRGADGMGAPAPPEQAGTPESPPRIWLHVLLFLATGVTTTLAISFLFSVTLLTILGIHEFGHYFASRRWGVKATLPYFIPAPIAFGTMGAVIKIKSPIPNRNALIDIGAAGPIAGFVAAIIALCVGLSLSEVKATEAGGAGLFLGDSLLSSLLADLIVGRTAPGTDIFLHPIAFAGWLGLFITVLNLLPVGQLDGGHIIYALFERRHAFIANVTTAALLLLTVVGPPYTWLTTLRTPGVQVAAVFKVWLAGRWYGWIFFIVIIRGFLGVRHPPLVEAERPLDPGRKRIGYMALAIFVLCFVPVPFSGF